MLEEFKQDALQRYEMIQQHRAEIEAGFYALMGLHPEYKETRAYARITRLFSEFPEKPKNFDRMDGLDAMVTACVDMKLTGLKIAEICSLAKNMADEKMDNAMGAIGDAE